MELESTIDFIRMQLSKSILMRTQNIEEEEANLLLQQDMERQSALIPW